MNITFILSLIKQTRCGQSKKPGTMRLLLLLLLLFVDVLYISTIFGSQQVFFKKNVISVNYEKNMALEKSLHLKMVSPL